MSDTEQDGHWKKRFENERAKRTAECFGCGLSIIFDSDRTTYDTKQVAHAVFRCWECGRLFCSGCAKRHFGFGGEQ